MIDKEITRRCIEEQISQLEREGRDLIEKHGWNIEVKDTTVYVKMRSIKDKEEYLLRIQCEGYPEKNLFIQFVDPSSRIPKSSAWPVDQPVGDRPVFLPDRMIICLVPKSGSVYAIPEVIQKIQFYLNYDGYIGRARSDIVQPSRLELHLGVNYSRWARSR